MRDDQRCGNCEWWDRPTDTGDFVEQRACYRWPGDPWLRTYETQRCWQWCAQEKGGSNPPWRMDPGDVKKAVVDPEPGGAYRAIRTEKRTQAKADLEKAVQLALDAGVSTGHAGSCTELVEELLRNLAELREWLNAL